MSRRPHRRGIPRNATDAVSKRASRSKAATVPANGDRAKVVTITDVARKARVGESTVSRVLRNQGSVSQQTREKILKAAADLNYVPNRIAGALASMTSKLIGIVIPSVGNTVVPEVLAGVNTVLEDAGFQPVIGGRIVFLLFVSTAGNSSSFSPKLGFLTSVSATGLTSGLVLPSYHTD